MTVPHGELSDRCRAYIVTIPIHSLIRVLSNSRHFMLDLALNASGDVVFFSSVRKENVLSIVLSLSVA